MTIEDRADAVALEYIQENLLPIATDSPKYRALVTAFEGFGLEVARDQRHACAEAIAAMPPIDRTIVQGCVLKDDAHQVVMNADIN